MNHRAAPTVARALIAGERGCTEVDNTPAIDAGVDARSPDPRGAIGRRIV